MDLIFVCLTHNPLKSLRWCLLERTVASARNVFGNCCFVLVDNQSYDGSHDAQLELATRYNIEILRIQSNFFGVQNITPGYGHNVAWLKLLNSVSSDRHSDTIVVMSDDDARWLPGSQEKIVSFWKNAPSEFALLGGYVEPEYAWSKIRGSLMVGGHKALIRDSVPGTGWAFRMDRGLTIFPTPMTFADDHCACLKLSFIGKKIAQMDLCEHIGEQFSSWDNQAYLLAKRVDKARWGL